MGWHDRLVYYRDFAYGTPRLRMANGNIGHVPAATFAEYVDDPFLGNDDGDDDSDTTCGEPLSQDVDAAPGVAPDADAHHAPRPQCLAVRPALAHRLYSHRLHVRAKAKLQRDRLLSGPMIDVYVGNARRRWTLHRTLLCHHSAQLEAELEGNHDGHDARDALDALELPDHDPAGFELLVKWLYQGRLDDVSDLADATQKYEHAVHCHALYLLCHRFDMPQLKNVAMDQFRKGLHEAELVPDPDEIDDLYRKTPAGSPFRRLLVQIAARQIMDPDSNRDVETYRQCFEHNASFALELVNAIRQGSGGMLLDDPTASGNECAYHDHQDAPHCNIKAKAKAKAKQARKAKAQRADPSSARSAASTSSDPPLRPHPRPPPRALPPPPPRILPLPPPRIIPPPPLRQPRPGSSADGLLRRRLTSPATSTVSTSTETALASHPPSPDTTQDWAKLKKVITPEKQAAGAAEAPKPHPVLAEHRRSSEDAPLPQQPSKADGEASAATNGSAHQSPPRRGIWEWARAGTGRLNIIGRLPHAEWKGPASASTAEGLVINGAQDHGRTTESHDDFDIPSATATEPDNVEKQETAALAKIEGLGISSLGTMMSPNDFSQTKRSSDDLIANASETTGSPSPRITRHEAWTNGDDTTPTASKPTSPTTPDTPTPPQRRTDSIMEMPKPRETEEPPTSKKTIHISRAWAGSEEKAKSSSTTPKTPQEQEQQQQHEPVREHDLALSAPAKANGELKSGQRRVPTYKIALASSLLSPARRSASAAH
ncbi:uncharacterized protein EKO05_0000753 [Ascochyta rabiei]|uniref:Uncharacterized protein n=1 Tax=Didymella rabiei TaxID=5454 RepID=A0A163CUX9_DIDRA|nr:uncharacterized protein EKO05_0000753 [Ascochyta rabiei]KZM22707.1 hypothetical protein ST47_g6125 [Ascochyta rabiei]UPX10081.1 hypothetical protein EKO05_0000753 [Ascochyta rabiei]